MMDYYRNYLLRDPNFRELGRQHEDAFDSVRRAVFAAGVERGLDEAERGAVWLRAHPDSKVRRRARRNFQAVVEALRLEAAGFVRMGADMLGFLNGEVVNGTSVTSERDSDETFYRVSIRLTPRAQTRPELRLFASTVYGRVDALVGGTLETVEVTDAESGHGQTYRIRTHSPSRIIAFTRHISPHTDCPEPFPLGLYATISSAAPAPVSPRVLADLRIDAPACLWEAIRYGFLPAWLETGAEPPASIYIRVDAESAFFSLTPFDFTEPLPPTATDPVLWLAEIGRSRGAELVALLYREAE